MNWLNLCNYGIACDVMICIYILLGVNVLITLTNSALIRSIIKDYCKVVRAILSCLNLDPQNINSPAQKPYLHLHLHFYRHQQSQSHRSTKLRKGLQGRDNTGE